jgi:hypothetical protein
VRDWVLVVLATVAGIVCAVLLSLAVFVWRF